MKPDVLVAYPPQEGFSPGAGAYAVAYVRPETNTVLYERAIVAGIRARGDSIIYSANLNGRLFREQGILRDHYVTQLAFAADPRGQAARYPQVAQRLTRHFGEEAGASLLGAFAAAERIPKEQLFETFVPPEDFLSCLGQQFKRIGAWIVANPGLPAVLDRYTDQANIFVVAVRSADGSPGFFSSLNRAIYQEISSRAETPLVDQERLGAVPWPERVRRTYHLSRTHLMAMFDLADFVFLPEGGRLPVTDTPLGRSLLEEGILSAQRLHELKREPLVCARGGGALHYLPLAGEGQELDRVREFLRRL